MPNWDTPSRAAAIGVGAPCWPSGLLRYFAAVYSSSHAVSSTAPIIPRVNPTLYRDEVFEDLLVDRSELLEEPEWIFQHVLPLLARAGFGIDVVLEAFDVDGADVDVMVDELMRSDAWPVVRIPLADEHEAVVVGRNLEGDFGIDYFLTHPSWKSALQIAADEGSYIGPGLCWPELVAVAGESATAMLALLPILGDSALPGDAANRVGGALAGIGIDGEDVIGLATALLAGHFNWGHEPWTWHDDDPRGGIWVCAGNHSERGGGFDSALSFDQASRLRRLLAGS